MTSLKKIRLPAVRANMPVTETLFREIQDVVNILQRICGVETTVFPIVKAGQSLTAVNLNKIYSAIINIEKKIYDVEEWENFPVKSGDPVTESMFNELIGTVNRIIHVLETTHKRDVKEFLEIQKLKSELSYEQLKVLNILSEYFVENVLCVPSRKIFIELNQPKAKDLIESIGGAYLVESNDNGKNCYQVTFLGLLLSERYSYLEKLLIKYLEIVRDKFVRNPECENISSDEISGFSVEELSILRNLLSVANFYHGSLSNPNSGAWVASFPEDVEELRFVEDLRDYLIKHAFKYVRFNDSVNLESRYNQYFNEQSKLNNEHLNGSGISPEPPRILKNIVWIRKNYKAHWKLLFLGGVIIILGTLLTLLI